MPNYFFLFPLVPSSVETLTDEFALAIRDGVDAAIADDGTLIDLTQEQKEAITQAFVTTFNTFRESLEGLPESQALDDTLFHALHNVLGIYEAEGYMGLPFIYETYQSDAEGLKAKLIEGLQTFKFELDEIYSYTC